MIRSTPALSACALLALVLVAGCRRHKSAPTETNPAPSATSAVHGGSDVATAPIVLTCKPVDCSDEGDKYAEGTGGVAVDLPKALLYYARACETGFALGCRDQAGLLLTGEGIPHDSAKALALYTRACTTLALACDDLGDVYLQGLGGVPTDPAKAATMYQKACDDGLDEGCGHIASLYRKGTGVKQDSAKAIALYDRGCTAGSDLSCDALGDMYAKGMGVPVDRAKAVTYYMKACNGGFSLGCDHAKGR
ncbi:MAG: hypothetical protein JWM74_5202 [Myxococcaceae bacterium]|nr:hypothetical protein [Myxococcaceae bacterium]